MSKAKEDPTLREIMAEAGLNVGDTLRFNGNDKRTLCLGVEDYGILCFVNRAESHNSVLVDLSFVVIDHIPCGGFIRLVLPDGNKASMWHRELLAGFKE